MALKYKRYFLILLPVLLIIVLFPAVASACGWAYAHSIYPIGIVKNKVYIMETKANRYWVNEGRGTRWKGTVVLKIMNNKSRFLKTDTFDVLGKNFHKWMDAYYKKYQKFLRSYGLNIPGSVVKTGYWKKRKTSSGGLYCRFHYPSYARKKLHIRFTDSLLKAAYNATHGKRAPAYFKKLSPTGKHIFYKRFSTPKLVVYHVGKKIVIITSMAYGTWSKRTEKRRKHKIYFKLNNHNTGHLKICTWGNDYYHHGIKFDNVFIVNNH